MSTSDGQYLISAVLDVILGFSAQYSNPIYLTAFIQAHLEFQLINCDQRRSLLEIVFLIKQTCNIVRRNKLIFCNYLYIFLVIK